MIEDLKYKEIWKLKREGNCNECFYAAIMAAPIQLIVNDEINPIIYEAYEKNVKRFRDINIPFTLFSAIWFVCPKEFDDLFCILSSYFFEKGIDLDLNLYDKETFLNICKEGTETFGTVGILSPSFEQIYENTYGKLL